ncbi:hypothetical protein Psi02_25300 [Planotetraspora silvatica]|uniref:Polysaccharide biosynthesis protein n=1 Tax=Planotetraspora silvatica TaxID=234614 RepID=A0A8J3UKF5_9ACTN|nr:hypothetical protein [Planotetraspora silvatica]GII46106.1 hypothetical protein Psi02_25300 [Planotetraspora silvatica]
MTGRFSPPGRRHLHTFTSLTAAGLAEAVVSSLGVVALVRLTGTERAGQAIFAQSVAGVWFLLCDPRLENAAQRFVPAEHRATGGGSALFLRLVRWDVAGRVATTVLGLAAVPVTWLLGFAGPGLALMLALAVVARGLTGPNGAPRAAFALTDRLRSFGVLRLACAGLSLALSVAGMLVWGAPGFLAGQAVSALVVAVTQIVLAVRAVRAAMGPPGRPGPVPPGLLGFTVKASGGTALAEVSDSGILAVAGLLGGSTLVTLLKIASAPGRLYASMIMPVASMLYPRLCRAVADGEVSTRGRRDLRRATLLLAAVGTLTLGVAVLVVDDVLRLVYGSRYGGLAAVAAVLVAAACVKGLVCWSNVLPLALGRPGWRLAYLGAEGLALVGLLLLAGLAARDAAGTSLLFACGTLAVSVCCAGTWLTLLGRFADDDAKEPKRPLRAGVRS